MLVTEIENKSHITKFLPCIFHEEDHEHDKHAESETNLRKSSNTDSHSRNHRYGCHKCDSPDDYHLVCRTDLNAVVNKVQSWGIRTWRLDLINRLIFVKGKEYKY